MILELVTKIRYEVDKELFDALEGDEIEEAMKDGRIKLIGAEYEQYEDGVLTETEIADDEDIENYVMEKA